MDPSLLGKNCLSIIVTGDSNESVKIDNHQLLEHIGNLGCEAESIKFSSQSNIVNEQTRKDLVFKSQTAALKVQKLLEEHCHVVTFLSTESELGYGLAPVLNEEEMINIIDNNPIEKNLMKGFDGKVDQNEYGLSFKCHSLASLNLFLYNFGGTSKCSLGLFKKSLLGKKRIALIPFERNFKLFIHHSKKGWSEESWNLLAQACEFDIVPLSINEKILVFATKLKFYEFWLGFTAKALKRVQITDMDIREEFESASNFQVIGMDYSSPEKSFTSPLLRQSDKGLGKSDKKGGDSTSDTSEEEFRLGGFAGLTFNNKESYIATPDKETGSSEGVLQRQHSKAELIANHEGGLELSVKGSGNDEVVGGVQEVANSPDHMSPLSNKPQNIKSFFLGARPKSQTKAKADMLIEVDEDEDGKGKFKKNMEVKKELKQKIETIALLEERLVLEQKAKLKLEAKLLPEEMQSSIQEETVEKQGNSLVQSCCDSKIKLSTILGLIWKRENGSGSNYNHCIADFLRNIASSLSNVFMKDGDIILVMESAAQLREALAVNVHEKMLESKLDNLKPRVRIVPHELDYDYRLEIYYEEGNFQSQSRQDLLEELSIFGMIGKNNFKSVTAYFRSLIDFVRALTNPKLISCHRVVPNKSCFELIGGNGENNLFKGQVCLTEANLMSIHYIGEQEHGFAKSFSKFLQDSRIQGVVKGNNGRLLITFYNLKALEDCLLNSCQFNCNTLAKLGCQTVRSLLIPRKLYYTLLCPPTAAKKDFVCYKDTCKLEDNPKRISSKCKVLLVKVLRDVMIKYPEVYFSEDNFLFRTRRGQHGSESEVQQVQASDVHVSSE